MDNDVNKSPQEGSASGEQAESFALAEDVLIEFARALKAVNFYPRGHPTLQISLDKGYKSLLTILGDGDQFALGISKDGFQISSKPLAPGNQVLAGLARGFFLRQIKKIFFLKGLDPQELENFLRVMAMEADLFRGKGKAEEYLTEGGVTHICANEIKLGQSLNVQRKQEELREAVPLDDRLEQLVQSLRTETDSRKYLALAREASVMATRFIDEGKLDAAFVFMNIFWEGFTVEPTRASMIVEGAKSGYRELSTPPMIEHILRQLTLLDGPRKEKVLDMAIGLGADLVDAILDKLATNEALYSHRALIQVLLSVPELSREPIESRLKDDRWWVARKMAFMLGEMGEGAGAKPLLDAVRYPDIRVRKEALKALVKIGVPEVIKRLIEIIDSKETQEMRIHAVRLLGMVGDRSATPSLVKILKNRGMLLDNIELLEEAVRALGKMKSPQAVPILSELLFKRSRFAQAKSINLGVEAAESLGAIGGEEAGEVLTKGTENKHSEIRLACLKALKANLKSANQADERTDKRE